MENNNQNFSLSNVLRYSFGTKEEAENFAKIMASHQCAGCLVVVKDEDV